MAVAIKGEVGFNANGEAWTLVYDFNALCTIEDDLEIDVKDVGEKLSSPKMIRSIFRIGLAAHHGAMTDLEAGKLIHDMGAPEAAQVIAKAFQAAFPEATSEDESAEGNVSKPKNRGTGRKP